MLYNLNFLLCSYMLTLIHFGLPPKWHQIQSMGLFLVYHIMSLTLTSFMHTSEYDCADTMRGVFKAYAFFLDTVANNKRTDAQFAVY